MLILNYLKKLKEKSFVKCYQQKSDRQNDFCFLFLCSKFLAITFFGWTILRFFQRSWTIIEFLRFILPISNFWRTTILSYISTFYKLKSDTRTNGSKTKIVSSKCVLELYLSSVSGLGSIILSKKGTLVWNILSRCRTSTIYNALASHCPYKF
jgi:hypothetical protein